MILPVAKFVANNIRLAITKITLFFTTRRYNPRISFDPVNIVLEIITERLLTSKVIYILNRTKTVIEAARSFIKDV